jgi:hypothetical protein
MKSTYKNDFFLNLVIIHENIFYLFFFIYIHFFLNIPKKNKITMLGRENILAGHKTIFFPVKRYILAGDVGCVLFHSSIPRIGNEVIPMMIIPCTFFTTKIPGIGKW